MAEYIEKEMALKLLTDSMDAYGTFSVERSIYMTARQKIKNIPSADVVPVVRCIVCRHGIPLQHSDYVECKIKGRMPKDGFCSYGERKEK